MIFSKWRSNFQNFTTAQKTKIIVVGILGAFLLLEGLARVAYWITGKNNDEQLSYYYLPHIAYFNKSGGEYDRLGFRLNKEGEQRDLLKKDPDEYRIFLFGGSTVHSKDAPDLSETFSALLMNKLNSTIKKTKNVRFYVINAGTSSFDSGQEFSLFTFYVLPKLMPDAVIFFDGSNDFTNWPPEGGEQISLLEGNYHPFEAVFFEKFNHMSSVGGNLINLLGQLGKHSVFLHGLSLVADGAKNLDKFIAARMTEPETLSKEIIKQHLGNHLKRYKRNIQNILTMAAGNGIPVAYLLQPTMLLDSHKLEVEEGMRNYPHTIWHRSKKAYLPAKQLFYDEMRKEFARLKETHRSNPNIYIEDLSHSLNGARISITS